MALDQRNLRVKEIERGRDSYARRAWADAYEALSPANQAAPLDADDLERLAWSAGLTARDDELLKLSEQHYQARVAEMIASRRNTGQAVTRGAYLPLTLAGARSPNLPAGRS